MKQAQNIILGSCIVFISFYQAVTHSIENDQKSRNVIIASICKNRLVSIYDLMQTHSKIMYQKVHDPIMFEYKPYPINIGQNCQPRQGTFAETFVVKIPQGKVCSKTGFIFKGNKVIREFFNQNIQLLQFLSELQSIKFDHVPLKKIFGRVVVLTRVDYNYYGHWIAEMLGRLELLRLAHVEYDWLYVPYDKKFIKESLDLLGVDQSKIIDASDEQNFYIQADELIVPSLTARRIPDGISDFPVCHANTTYTPEWVAQFLRDTFLPMAHKDADVSKFSEKIFISRKDAAQRKMINEDEIFALFEIKGFKRYELSKMTFLDAIELFKKAKHVVGTHGSSLTNILFCDPGTKVLEIIQDRYDSSFWNMSQTVCLNHVCMQTRWPINYSWHQSLQDTVVPVDLIQNYIQKHL